MQALETTVQHLSGILILRSHSHFLPGVALLDNGTGQREA